MSKSKAERLPSSDIIIIENHFYSPSSSTLDDAKKEYEKAIENGLIIESSEEETTAVIRRRIRTTWNNAKYNNKVSRWVLKRRSSFDKDHPVWLLGKIYSWQSDTARRTSITNGPEGVLDDAYRAFFADFSSRIWFTYRKDFAKLNGCRLKSDCGWGCMLRCGQMLMAQTLVCHILGRDWTQIQDRDDANNRKWHRQIVEWFLDCPKRPFSLHRMVEMGLSHGKRGGDWYGPASTALILRDALVNRQLQPSPDNAELDNLSIFVAADGVVYLDELQTCVQHPSANAGENENAKFGKSLLLIIPLRLGADKCNPVYIYHLKTVLSLKSCVGILGGRPKHSMYFIGWQRDSMIYLDPHYCQDAIEIEDTTEFPLQTFHCKWPRKIPFSDIDPSCAVGFYLRAGTSFSDFMTEVSDIVEYRDGGNAPVKFPLFSVMKKRQSMRESRLDSLAEESTSGSADQFLGRRRSSASGFRDYVFL